MAATKPALKKEKGTLRNPVPRQKFTMKKNARKMFTVFGPFCVFLVNGHDNPIAPSSLAGRCVGSNYDVCT